MMVEVQLTAAESVCNYTLCAEKRKRSTTTKPFKFYQTSV